MTGVSRATPRRAAWAAALAAMLPAGPAAAAPPFAAGLPWPAVATHGAAPATARIPAGPFADGSVPTAAAQGAVTSRAWRVDAPGLSTAALIAALAAALEADGYAPGFACAAGACGGWDFRFALDLPPPPAMHVDILDYRFLSATRGAEAVALVVSRSDTAGFVHMIHMGPAEAAPALTAATKSPETAGDGPRVLSDVGFAPGTADLPATDPPALVALAAQLAADPALRVTITGHTDATGDPAANRALSAARAAAVRDRLLALSGADPARITAEGRGADEPRATNATPEGRAENRRVEVTRTPTPVQAP